MSNFWESKSGAPITGTPEASFVKDYSTIPEGTAAIAKIKAFEVIEKISEYNGAEKYIQVTYKLTSGEFCGREVTQKIKCFDGKPATIDRSLNMLRLIMDLCGFKPVHHGEPTNQELMQMNGKIVGIKIGEWEMPKKDGSGMMEGNHIREVWAAEGFQTETGIKAERVHTMPSDSALSRNAQSRTGSAMPDINDDLPF